MAPAVCGMQLAGLAVWLVVMWGWVVMVLGAVARAVLLAACGAAEACMVVLVVWLLLALLRGKAVLWWEELRVERLWLLPRLIVAGVVSNRSAVYTLQVRTTAAGAAAPAAWNKLRAHQAAQGRATKLTCTIDCYSSIWPLTWAKRISVLDMLQLLRHVLHAAEPRQRWQGPLGS